MFLCSDQIMPSRGDTPFIKYAIKGVAEIVPTFETAFARMRAYAVCECHKGLYYHHVD